VQDSKPKQRGEQIRRIQEGDEAAFEELFHTYYGKLCHFVEQEVNSSEVAEDLVQKVFLNLWRRRQDWQPKTTIRSYLFGAVQNESIKYRKHRQVRRQWKEEEKERKRGSRELDPEASFQRREIDEALKERVAELPERQRQVYVLSRRHGLTYEEIATVMDISPKTVDNHMVKALKFLREGLRRYHPQASG